MRHGTQRPGRQRQSGRGVRLGIICLLASGILSVVGLRLRGPIVDQARRPDEYVENALSPTHDLAWAMLLPSLIVQMFGWLALWEYLRGTPEERLAFWGMALSVAGNSFFLPSVGVIAFASRRRGTEANVRFRLRSVGLK